MGLAFIFPGQGSQSIGMLADLAVGHHEVEDTFAEASQVLGYDLWMLVSNGPEERLNQTQQTQPAMLAAGVATWRTWAACGGPRPDILAGHSLGEYSALVCAGSLAFPTAVALVAARGQFMQEAVPTGQGAIAAVLGLDDQEVLEACREAVAQKPGKVVAAVNFNAPGQVVIAGHAEGVAVALELAKGRGARRVVNLPMSVPVHCELMRPATARLAALLKETEIRPPEIPVVNNADVRIENDPNAIRDALERQLFSPVQWADTVHRLAEQGAGIIVECGPGRVLTGLMRRIDRELTAMSIHDPKSLGSTLERATELP